MSSTSQSQTAVGVLIVLAIYLALMLLQAYMDEGSPRGCGSELAYMDPSCGRVAYESRD